MNLAYTLGFFAGIASVAVVGSIIAIIYKKKYGRKKNEYDERQKALRGKAYKAAYFTLLAYLVISGLVTKGFGIHWAEGMVEAFLGIFLSVAVFVIICIKNDAYFSLSDRPTTYLALFSIIGFFNIGISTIEFVNHESFVTNGMLNEKTINLFCGIMFIILAITMAAKMLHEKHMMKRDGDYEES
jgi:cytochrome bd-type quinol oxidase subunit 2